MGKDKDRYKMLIKKALSEDASAEEIEELAKLPNVERRMKAQWADSGKEEADNRLEQRIWQRIENGCCNKQSKMKKWLYVRRVVAAACIALLAVAGIYWLNAYMDEVSMPRFIDLVAHESRRILLPDSSLVWLKDGSSIRYKKRFAKDRKVWLQGEAIFEVKKQEESPFKVLLDATFVEVKGTVFRVVNRKEQPQEVDLFSGKVEFNAAANNRKVTMRPNQYLVYAPEKDELEVREMDRVNWKDGRYTFRETRTDTLIRIVGHIFNTPVVMADEVGENEYFNGSIRMDETLEDVLEKICYNLDINYKKEENRYILYK